MKKRSGSAIRNSSPPTKTTGHPTRSRRRTRRPYKESVRRGSGGGRESASSAVASLGFSPLSKPLRTCEPRGNLQDADGAQGPLLRCQVLAEAGRKGGWLRPTLR